MAEEKRLPSFLLRIAYDIIAEETLNRAALNRVLEMAGLQRYADNRPPLDNSPSITLAEYAKLIGVVWQVFDEVQAREIFRRTAQCGFENLTRSGALMYTQFLRAFDSLGTKRERVALAMSRLADELTRAMGNRHEFHRDGDDFLLDIFDCPYCAELLKRPPPVAPDAHFCHIPVAFYEAAVTWASGEQHVVQEIACRVTTRQDFCRFKIFWNIALRKKI